ncbi:MAG: acyltransferase family protein [Prevotella sp.]|nr:acyltransferase family protein [Prevotella sp.]MBQ8060084.1 acyltransferase family protein [Prevotella sp.]
MKQRINELDFLKGVLIILMISFHLVYFSELHPYAKQVVYTFHMPGFLIMSGFLMNVSKPWKAVLLSMLSYAVPYAIMESGYIAMASVLPIREHIDHLTVPVFLDRLLLHPIGPYWYLQTLIICGLLYALVSRLPRLTTVTRLLTLGIAFYILADCLGIMAFGCTMYFLAGVALKHSNIPFTNVFQPSALSIAVFTLLALHPCNLKMQTAGGALMVWLIISSLLFIYKYTSGKARATLLYLGRNSMPLFLFSPIFTFLCKPLVPYLRFDTTGLIFLFLSLIICISGSLCVDWIMRRTGLSQLFYAKRHKR